MITTLKSALTGFAVTLALGISPAFAQSPAPFSSKPITFVVPFTAGSGTDVVARVISDHLSKALGQTIVVDNKAGAGGTLGAAQVASSTPDGLTVLIHSAGHVANAALYPKLKYDTLKDFTPVAMLATLPNVLVVSPASGIKSVEDLVRKAQANPGKMTYASAGNGSATHINAEKFRIAARIQASHVPYRGTPPALMDVAGGQVDWFFAPLVSALPLIQEQKVVPLAVGSQARSAAMPKLPTTVEAGFPGSDYTFWVGMFVPAKTPADTVKRLADATSKALQMAEVKAALEKIGAEVPTLSQQQFADGVAREMSSTSALIRQAGIRVD
ncbi:Bug family tripartite tricarboxylate transporter substrate binding protein [Azohydromonas lata]|uniref:Tripartite tricarboxylate transporter substrate-binding protein n=1 Tax=Azohydromonas lata TaxID=45677 RepID=A0ABU5IG32_9BURK|nr:tripartite tricarboxylate transporter substrate-binding protein [Azohydromonas lata]MDZ5458029.1 tripartite tricarboxylate transporter substrate-binding protein [Azohydromonas lata]